MIRSVVYKDDSFIVKYVLKNELSEPIVKPRIDPKIDTNLFDVLHDCLKVPWWHSIPPSYELLYAQILRAKDSIPEGYYRFDNPIIYYKLKSDSDTDPERAVATTPPDVILTSRPYKIFLTKKYFDLSKPYAETFLKKLKSTFRICEIEENITNTLVQSECACAISVATEGYIHYSPSIILGPGTYGHLYKDETANSDEVASVNYFGFNMPQQITVAKAGETLRYFDLSKVKDSQVVPIVSNGDRGYVLLLDHKSLLIAENSFLERDEIYNLIANFIAIQHMANAQIDYYDKGNYVKTFTLPDRLLWVWWISKQYGLAGKNFRFPAETDVRCLLYILNFSKTAVPISKCDILLDDKVIQTYNLNWSIGVFGSNALYITIPAQPSTVITGENIGTGDGSTTKFYLSKAPVKEGSEKIYVNGELKTRGTDYEINYENGEISFTTAPADGAQITADYTYYRKFRVSFLDDAENEVVFVGEWASFE